MPQAWNLLATSMGNPLRFVDPEGLSIALPADYQDELGTIRGYLIAAGAGALANALSVHSVNGENQIAPVDPGLIDSSNSTSALIGGLINDKKHTVSFDITSETVPNGGAQTTGSQSDPDRVNIRMNPSQVGKLPVAARPLSGAMAGALVLGTMTAGPAGVHELGHAKAHFDGFRLGGGAEGLLFPGSTPNDIAALRYENQHRYMLKGPENFLRTNHGAWAP